VAPLDLEGTRTILAARIHESAVPQPDLRGLQGKDAFPRLPRLCRRFLEMMAMKSRSLLAIVLSLLMVHGVFGQVAFLAGSRSQKQPQQTRRQQIAERQNREFEAMIADHHHTDYRRQTVRSPLNRSGVPL